MTLRAVLAAFLKRDLFHEMSYRFAFAMEAFGILFSVVLWYFAGAFLQRQVPLAGRSVDYFPYVLVGIASMHYLHAALQGFSQSLRTEQMTGTLEILLAAPAPLGWMALGSVQWAFLVASLRVLAFVAAGAFLFGMPLHPAGLPGFALALALMTASAAALGLLSASFVIVFKRGDPVNFVMTAASTLLGGVFFPSESLPSWLEGLSRLLPLTYALRAMRASLLLGAGFGEVLPDLGALVLFAVLMLPLALWVFGRALDLARRNGTLVQY
jgi:ABC-2 type transport system permease protein